MQETHKYYSHTVRQGEDHFYDLDQLNKTGPHAGRVKQHNMLSQSYRRAATINLSFKFPFYGHQVENITIATGGFLYTGDYVHSWLAATQYIAPLMANFDTSKNYNAKIRYLDDRSKLIVEWKDVHLQEKKNEGSFTFQVILFANGNITFAYHTIPIDIINIMDEDHPVKVGLSDAYIIDRTVYCKSQHTRPPTACKPLFSSCEAEDHLRVPPGHTEGRTHQEQDRHPVRGPPHLQHQHRL